MMPNPPYHARSTADLTPRSIYRGAMRERAGFLTLADTDVIAADPQCKGWPLLIRCGLYRYVVPASMVRLAVDHIVAAGDHVRDFSFLAGWAPPSQCGCVGPCDCIWS